MNYFVWSIVNDSPVIYLSQVNIKPILVYHVQKLVSIKRCVQIVKWYCGEEATFGVLIVCKVFF